MNGFLIYESDIHNVISLLSAPALIISFYIFSFHISYVYPLPTSIYKNSYSLIKHAKRVKLYLPEPPNPISNECPYVIFNILYILNT